MLQRMGADPAALEEALYRDVKRRDELDRQAACERGLLPPGEPEDALCNFILSFDRRNGSLARAMVNFCRKSYGHLPQDDMTAVVIDVRKSS